MTDDPTPYERELTAEDDARRAAESPVSDALLRSARASLATYGPHGGVRLTITAEFATHADARRVLDSIRLEDRATARLEVKIDRIL